jgi:hypothetical protein
MTEWLTFAWVEMLWKFCAEKFLFEAGRAIVPKKHTMHNRQNFSMD